MEKLTSRAKALAHCYGAGAVGIATIDMLKGGPPSADLTYVLPNAKSAMIFAIPLDQNLIEPYFAKKDHTSHFQDNIHKNVIASGISLELANYLDQKGYPSIALNSNAAYRSDTPNGRFDEKPPISHRYLDVASGIGVFWAFGELPDANRRGRRHPGIRRYRSRIDTHPTDTDRGELLRRLPVVRSGLRIRIY